ncbi:MAG: helix-turn-helix transcriptional regulator [Ramlibacter sp.]|nr:helix-turn-helix transcriptional regulator [Ramlibacter sp.]
MDGRAQKLKGLIASPKFDGKQAELARKAGISPSQLNQWLTGYRNIGEKAARSLEESLDLPAGWLDMEEGQAAWPLPKVPMARYLALSDEDKRYIQALLEQAIEHCEQHSEERQGPRLAHNKAPIRPDVIDARPAQQGKNKRTGKEVST